MTSLQLRWNTFSYCFDTSSQKILRAYRKQRACRSLNSLGEPFAFDHPYWLIVPQWFGERYACSGNRFFNDILWGQYCLFLSVRMKDDLFDGQTEYRGLVHIADQFLSEGEKQFQKHFSGEKGFWKRYHGLLRETTQAILDVSELQHSVNSSAKELLDRYRHVNAVFKIGTLALCTRYGQRKHFQLYERFSDHMAKASQILDDFKDIAEDVDAGRLNYAVKRILSSHELRYSIDKQHILSAINAGLFLTPIGNELLSEAKNHFAKAFDALQPLEFPKVEGCRMYYLHSVDRIIERFQQQRCVSLLMGEKRDRRKFFRAA